MWLSPPSLAPFPLSHPSRTSSSPRRGCHPCWYNDFTIAAAFGIPASLVGLLAEGEGSSARLLPPHNGDKGVKKAANGMERGGSCLTCGRQALGRGWLCQGGQRAELPACPRRCPPELSAPITALNGRGRPPAQGAFIPSDGNREKRENAALRGLRSRSCDVSVSDFTGDQRRGQGPPPAGGGKGSSSLPGPPRGG